MVAALCNSYCSLKELTNCVSSYFGQEFIVRLKKTWWKVNEKINTDCKRSEVWCANRDVVPSSRAQTYLISYPDLTLLYMLV